MAQLTDDCFAFGGRLLALAEAEQRIAERFACIAGTERVPLVHAAGRILAADAIAGLSVPPLTNSAVDGYAVHHADLLADRPTILPVIARAAAGHPTSAAIPRGHAARVFTGALMPAGPDTVMMQEDCEATTDGVLIRPGIRRGANRRLAGEDIAAGDLALPAGTRLTPADLALLAAIGQAEAEIRRPLRVALFSTGDEVAEPGARLRPGQIFDANRIMLAALLRNLGAAVTDGAILPDSQPRIAAALRDAAGTHDLVLTSGGVSTGEEDHIRAAIEQHGSIGFWRIGIKPGRPVALGDIGGTPILGLPGNPVAALVTFITIARPLLDRLSGARPRALPRFPVQLGFAWRKKPDRREYLRVTLEPRDGALHATLFPKEGAGIITSLTHSDALLELPEETTRLAPGDAALAIPLAAIWGS
jgi:molybdopterin molybdotransferase